MRALIFVRTPVSRTGLSMGQIKKTINKLRTAGKVDISKVKHKKTIWTLGEGEEQRKEHEEQESRIFASNHIREITKKAFLKRSYR